MNEIPDSLLLKYELECHGIKQDACGSFSCPDECENIEGCLKKINSEIRVKKNELLLLWTILTHLSESIINEPEYNNRSCLDNLLFLNSVKNAHSLADAFDDLKEATTSIRKIFQLDVTHINHDFITQFNDLYLEIISLHSTVMKEIYKTKLIKRYLKMYKVAGISGPFANLDLPIEERMWGWDEDEEYFDNRTEARKKQTRYNPEYSYFGVYYEWRDENRNPYRFGDKDESPYQSRLQISIP